MMGRRSIGMRETEPLGVDVPVIPDPYIVSISAYLFKVNTPTDDVIIKCCYDDAGGDVPGTMFASLTLPAAGLTSGAWSTPAEPTPRVELAPLSYFWLLFDRTGAYDLGNAYTISEADATGKGEAGHGHYALDIAGFQWQGVDSFGVDDPAWYTYTTRKLATAVVFSDESHWHNVEALGHSLAFGRGFSNSKRGASKYQVT